MLKIISRDNQKIKFARQVRDGRERDFVFVEGARLAEEVLKSKSRFAKFFSPKALPNGRGRSFLNSVKTKSESLAKFNENFRFDCRYENFARDYRRLRKTSDGRSGSSVRAADQKSALSLVILLHEINNPNNLGAILRTAEAVDVSGVILTKIR